MKILVPVRHPLTAANKAAIRRGLDLIEGSEDPELLIFHLNELHLPRRIGREELRDAVEAEFGETGANYLVGNGFLAEEAFVQVALQLRMDRAILSRERRGRWSQLLESMLDFDGDPGDVLREVTGLQVEVVDPVDG